MSSWEGAARAGRGGNGSSEGGGTTRVGGSGRGGGGGILTVGASVGDFAAPADGGTALLVLPFATADSWGVMLGGKL